MKIPPGAEPPCRVCGDLHAEQVAMHFPIRGGGYWILTEERYQHFNLTYAGPRYQGVPRVDLDGELLKMREWLHANPHRMKTARGMGAFVTRWLNRAMERTPGVWGPVLVDPAHGLRRRAGD